MHTYPVTKAWAGRRSPEWRLALRASASLSGRSSSSPTTAGHCASRAGPSSWPQVGAQLVAVAGGFGAEVSQHPLGIAAYSLDLGAGRARRPWRGWLPAAPAASRSQPSQPLAALFHCRLHRTAALVNLGAGLPGRSVPLGLCGGDMRLCVLAACSTAVSRSAAAGQLGAKRGRALESVPPGVRAILICSSCGRVARRAPGRPPTAEPGADAGPVAERSGAALINTEDKAA